MKHKNIIVALLFVIVIGLVIIGYAFYESSKDYSLEETYIEIQEGATLGVVSSQFKELIDLPEHIFKALFYVQGIQNSIKSGTYYLDESFTLLEISKRLSQSRYNLPQKNITIIEGWATYQFSDRLAAEYENISAQEFERHVAANNLEGYLYPDTYAFSENATSEVVTRKMKSNFDKKIAQYTELIEKSPYTLDQIVTMASLIENEAGGESYEIKQEVAGILWNRVRLGMPIQADAVFPFIFQKHLPRVLFVHLEVDSPYNIYKNIGLPPGPIGNPHIDSIRAAADPSTTDNLFYLTGFDGEFYFAKTNGGHEQNRRVYLNYRN